MFTLLGTDCGSTAHNQFSAPLAWRSDVTGTVGVGYKLFAAPPAIKYMRNKEGLFGPKILSACSTRNNNATQQGFFTGETTPQPRCYLLVRHALACSVNSRPCVCTIYAVSWPLVHNKLTPGWALLPSAFNLSGHSCLLFFLLWHIVCLPALPPLLIVTVHPTIASFHSIGELPPHLPCFSTNIER